MLLRTTCFSSSQTFFRWLKRRWYILGAYEIMLKKECMGKDYKVPKPLVGE